PTSQARGRLISLAGSASSRAYCRSPLPGEPRRASPRRSAEARRLLPAPRPPRGRRRRAAVRESQRPELAERANVDEPLEVDDLLDRTPVVDPATAVEFRLVGQIEAQALRIAMQLQQEPALLLPDAERGLLSADITLR